MRFFYLFVIGPIAAGVFALPASSPLVEHERRDYTSNHWVKRGRVEGKAELPVRVGLTQNNLDIGHDLLMDVSRHDSPNYGKHYTAEQVAEIFAPSQASVDAVREWLQDGGIEPHRISQSVNKQWLQFDTAAEKLEALLSAEYHVYEHADLHSSNIACDKYHVPQHVSKHIDYITPGIKLLATPGKPGRRSGQNVEKRASLHEGGKLIPSPMHRIASIYNLTDGNAEPNCTAGITPQCIKLLYKIPDLATAVPNNAMGIIEAFGDRYYQADLDSYFAAYAPKIPQGTHPVLDGIDGGEAPASNRSEAGSESGLDIQVAFPIVYPQEIVVFQSDDSFYESNYIYRGFFNNFLDAIDGSYCSYSAFGEEGNSPLDPPYPDPHPGGYKGKLQCGKYKPTNVISISYTGQESNLPVSYQRRQCNEFMKLGMQGVSIVISSGDNGVAGASSPDSPNGCLGAKGKIFDPAFPVTCPYLTTVGATSLPPGADASKDEEVAITTVASGGGFSNIYPIPDYQRAAVEGYLKYAPPYPFYRCTFNSSSCGTNSGDVGGGIYNRAGRGFPDVSAIGDNILTFSRGHHAVQYGTSASTPVFAAILNRINEERIRAGKSTIGFVNPVLYAHPETLHDITVGSNPGCDTQGFSAAPGWDPVTGLGTPNYSKMLKLFMSMP